MIEAGREQDQACTVRSRQASLLHGLIGNWRFKKELRMPDLIALHEAPGGVVLGGRGLPEVLTDITMIGRREIPGSEASSIT